MKTNSIFYNSIPARVQDQVALLTDKEQESLLLQLEDSKFWPAIVRYFGERFLLLQQELYTLDPGTEPTKMARRQGNLAGITDLQGYIFILKSMKKTKDEAEQREIENNK